MVALLMTGLLVFAVLALDGGRFYTQRRTAQNAADMAALAGIYKFRNAPNRVVGGVVVGKDISDSEVLTKIVSIAQANNIADTDADPLNAVNGNVQAWWINNNNDIVAEIDNDPSQFPPMGANGIKVETYIPYQTFIGGLIRQETLTAQADGTSRVVWGSQSIPGVSNQSVWVGGGSECNNITDRIAYHYSNTNSADFYGTTYIDGSLTVGAVNSTHFHGDVNVTGPVGWDSGVPDGPYTAYTGSDPFRDTSHSNHFDAGYDFHTISSSSGMMSAEQIDHTYDINGNRVDFAARPLQASDFLPPDGAMYKWYLYYFQPLGLVGANFYHTIAGDSAPGDLSAGNAASRVSTAWDTGDRGVFYIDGNLTVPNGVEDWPGVTLIVKDTFLSLDNHHTYGTAGAAAKSISVLAGKDLSVDSGNTADRCASDSSKWVFRVDAQNNLFTGVIYVPNGQALFVGNTSGGAHSAALVSYSLYLGMGGTGCNIDNGNGGGGCEAQSWSFNFNSSQMDETVATTTLQQ
jgi:hypothetical protein